ncbi:probable transmembrane reductase CYB561D1 isoform X1 [Hypanus sabinus]|uniref:probable transmembrane reductase CYB561D1 isoform X1 n=2 Tax=Hypanus sabinus TaxID=79690 RepID=UPI0028C3F283|nr:probable transmembrane reductase CYB561D1 isoform X1 [Hypanus sabinus]
MRSSQWLSEPLGARVGQAGHGSGARRCGLYLCLRKTAGAAAHLSALGLSIYVGVLSRLGTSRFSWHPACMAVAVCFCMTEAILIFSMDSSPFFCCSVKAKVRLHWMMQVLAVIIGSIGLIFIVSSKNISESPHLTSWHSILGIGTAIAVCGQLLCGLCLLFPKLINAYSVTRLRLYHATCGLVAYLMGTATVMLGLCSDWFKAQVNVILWYSCLIVPLIPALVIMNQVNNGYLSKKKIVI